MALPVDNYIMTLEQQVCSLDLAKQLKKLGVKQESLYWWSEHTQPPTLWSEKADDDNAIWDERQYSAFTVAELGEMLPGYIESKGLQIRMELQCKKLTNWNKYSVEYRIPSESYAFTTDEIILNADTEADARAKMLIYLLENKLIEISAN